jgi:hypothetical protein
VAVKVTESPVVAELLLDVTVVVVFPLVAVYDNVRGEFVQTNVLTDGQEITIEYFPGGGIVIVMFPVPDATVPV